MPDLLLHRIGLKNSPINFAIFWVTLKKEFEKVYNPHDFEWSLFIAHAKTLYQSVTHILSLGVIRILCSNENSRVSNNFLQKFLEIIQNWRKNGTVLQNLWTKKQLTFMNAYCWAHMIWQCKQWTSSFTVITMVWLCVWSMGHFYFVQNISDKSTIQISKTVKQSSNLVNYKDLKRKQRLIHLL